MRLVSIDGAEVELCPVGYQFPHCSELGDWDANWLMIAGAARLASGEAWKFRDSCLTTWEAASLAEWLRQTANGIIKPVDFPSDEERLKVFTEPNVAFSLAARTSSTCTVRVHFSLESRPAWLTDDDPDLFDFFVEVEITKAALLGATTEWLSELAAFPAR